MTPEEAVRRCEWWTLNEAETIAIGSTKDPEVGTYLNGDEFQSYGWGQPVKRLGWAITIPRSQKLSDGKEVHNMLFTLVVKELERRGQGTEGA
jgi:hypothetical protein